MGSSPPADTREGPWRIALRLLHLAPFRRLVTGQAAGQAADGFLQIAFAQVVLFEVGQGATPWEITKLLVVSLVPYSLVGPFAGVLIDRFDRRRVLVVVSLVRIALAIASIGVVALGSQPLAYATLLVLLSTSRFVLAAKGAGLPVTVGERDLVGANAVSSIGGMVAAFLGAVIGATFVAVAPEAGLVVAAAGYGLAAAAFARLGAVGGGATGERLSTGLRRVAGELYDGLRFSAVTAGVRRPLLAVAANRLLLGVGFVVLVLVADERYRLEAPGYGLALAVTGAGAFAGTWLAPRLAARYHRHPLLPIAFLPGAAAAALGGFAPNLPMLVTGVGIAALAFQVVKLLVDALVQEASPDRVRGRVFSVYDMVYNVAFVGAALALVPVWEPGRERSLLLLLAVAFVLLGAGLAASLRTWPFGQRWRGGVAGPKRRWPGRLAAIVAGAIPSLAFPEPGIWVLGFVGLVPLLVLLARAPSWREAAWRGWMGGMAYMAATHAWLIPTTGLFTIPAAMLLGALWIPWTLAAWASLRGALGARRLVAACAVVPAAFVFTECVRSWDRLGGPWGVLGATQWQNHSVLAAASLGGVWLLSVALVAVNVGTAAAFMRATRRGARVAGLGVAIGATVVVGGLGFMRPPLETTSAFRVGGVQPGVVHDEAERFAAHETLTATLAGRGLDLVVWAESSVGFDLGASPEYEARLTALSRRVNAPILVNIDAGRPDTGEIAKAAVLVGSGGVEARYDKMRLVPFGEYIPLRPLLGWIADVSDAAASDRVAGARLVVMAVGGVDVGPLVCFESSFPDLARTLAAEGADVIVLQTATTTFQDTWAQAQHAALAAVRAVESGRPVIHAAVSGITAAFDGEGRRLLWMSADEVGAWEVAVPLTQVTTVYRRAGDWVPATAAIVLLGAAAATGLRSARRGAAAGGSEGAVPRVVPADRSHTAERRAGPRRGLATPPSGVEPRRPMATAARRIEGLLCSVSGVAADARRARSV